MSKKSSKSKPDSTPEMPLDGKGVKPVENKFARAVQMEKEFTPGFDDNALRRLAKADNLNPATGQPWIPAPIKGHYEIAPTVRGVIAWLKHQADRGSTLPDFASMEICETAGHIPRTMQKWAQKRGINFQKSNKGIDYEALLIGLNEKLFTPMFSGDTSKISALGIGGMAMIDGEYEKNKGIQLDNERKQREEDEAKKVLQRREDCDIEIWGNQLLPFRNALLTFAKRNNLMPEMLKLLADFYQKLPSEKLELEKTE